MNIEIKNRFNGDIIIVGEYKSIKDALEKNKGANLRCANLEGADLRYANLEGAKLGGANLEGADLRYANLEGADLRYANLGGANLEGANLRYANLEGADLRGANLEGANLRCANLEGANLRCANLEGANLEGANLRYADLEGANGIELPIFNITGTVHSLFYIGNNIKIGCEEHSVNFWIENYKSIGEKNDYSPEQIEEYKKYIFMVAEFNKNKKENDK